MKTIVLDPGHGDTRGAKRYDSGVPLGERHEASAALEMGFTIKHVTGDKFKVVLTRDGTRGAKPDLAQRVRLARNADAAALVSLHFNCVGCGNLIYFAPGKASLALARLMGTALGIKRIVPSSSSRFNGLYIDAFPDARPAIMIEFSGIEFAPLEGEAGKAKRLLLAGHVKTALLAYFDA